MNPLFQELTIALELGSAAISVLDRGESITGAGRESGIYTDEYFLPLERMRVSSLEHPGSLSPFPRIEGASYLVHYHPNPLAWRVSGAGESMDQVIASGRGDRFFAHDLNVDVIAISKDKISIAYSTGDIDECNRRK
jgi:hypothetical protein